MFNIFKKSSEVQEAKTNVDYDYNSQECQSPLSDEQKLWLETEKCLGRYITKDWDGFPNPSPKEAFGILKTLLSKGTPDSKALLKKWTEWQNSFGFVEVEGYKFADENFCCRDFQYEIGKTYYCEGFVLDCCSGYHFCKNPIELLGFKNENTKLLKVKALVPLKRIFGSDYKLAAKQITIVEELDFDTVYTEEVIKQALLYYSVYGDGKWLCHIKTDSDKLDEKKETLDILLNKNIIELKSFCNDKSFSDKFLDAVKKVNDPLLLVKNTFIKTMKEKFDMSEEQSEILVKEITSKKPQNGLRLLKRAMSIAPLFDSKDSFLIVCCSFFDKQ